MSKEKKTTKKTTKKSSLHIVPDPLVRQGVKSGEAGVKSVEPIKESEVPPEVKKMMEEAKVGKVNVKDSKIQDVRLPVYKIIENEDKVEFEKEIVDAILHGFVPLGGVTVLSISSTHYKYIQAVIG